MKRIISLTILCWAVLLSWEVQAQQGPSDPEYRRTPAELHQLQQQAKAERKAQKYQRNQLRQANQSQRLQASQSRKQVYQQRQAQKQQQASTQQAALMQHKHTKQMQQQRKQLQKQKKKGKKAVAKQKQLAKKRERNLQHHNKQLRRKQKQNQVQANRTLATNRKQVRKLDKQTAKANTETRKTQKFVKNRYNKPIAGTTVLNERPVEPHPASKAAYLGKLLQVSPRIQFGVGAFRSTMTYDSPDYSLMLGNTINDLKVKFPWVPWKSVSLTPSEGSRTRTVSQNGKFFGTFGLNLPIVFLDLEAGAGRFTRPTLLLGDIWPPGELFRLEQLTTVMINRVTQSKPQRGVTMRVGVEAERLIPEQMLPKLEFGRATAGVDASIYYLFGVDMSFRPGIELLGENAEESLLDAFSSVPLVTDAVKQQTAQAILNSIEESLPLYPWLPAMKGIGFSAKGYLDLGRYTRFEIQYHLERARGLSFSSGSYLQRGPSVKRSFFTFGITTQL